MVAINQTIQIELDTGVAISCGQVKMYSYIRDKRTKQLAGKSNTATDNRSSQANTSRIVQLAKSLDTYILEIPMLQIESREGTIHTVIVSILHVYHRIWLLGTYTFENHL